MCVMLHLIWSQSNYSREHAIYTWCWTSIVTCTRIMLYEDPYLQHLLMPFGVGCNKQNMSIGKKEKQKISMSDWSVTAFKQKWFILGPPNNVWHTWHSDFSHHYNACEPLVWVDPMLHSKHRHLCTYMGSLGRDNIFRCCDYIVWLSGVHLNHLDHT